MSEPMSSVEIEDVLSSIRRLVSEDLRPASRASAPVPPRTAPAPEGGKLILTPALRVVPADGDSSAEPAGADADQEAAPTVAEAAPQALSDADAVTAAAPEGDDWQEPPTFHSIRHDGAASAAAAAPASVADSVSAFGAAMDDGPDALREDWETEEAGFVDVSDSDMPGFDMRGPDAAEILTLDRFALDRAPSLASDVADAMGAGVDAPSPPLAEPVDTADLDWLPEDGADWTAADAYDPPEATPAAAPSAAPDDADADLSSRAWADAAEAEVLRRLSEDSEPQAFRMEGAAPDALYDEEVLRDLVRDIIREELQGALGERITRNVRKLVRAEISRALAVRDFE